MSRQSFEHRFRHHHPHIFANMPNVIKWLILGMDGFLNYQEKPRCTFAELGGDCPVVKEFKLSITK